MKVFELMIAKFSVWSFSSKIFDFMRGYWGMFWKKSCMKIFRKYDTMQIIYFNHFQTLNIFRMVFDISGMIYVNPSWISFKESIKTKWNSMILSIILSVFCNTLPTTPNFLSQGRHMICTWQRVKRITLNDWLDIPKSGYSCWGQKSQ